MNRQLDIFLEAERDRLYTPYKARLKKEREESERNKISNISILIKPIK